MIDLDQGSIIYGIRSIKYNSTPCYAVVLSASCDLYNCKISKVYYVCAIKVDDWILSDFGFRLLIKSVKDKYYYKFQNLANESKLNGEVLINFSFGEIQEVLNNQVKKNKVQQDILNNYKQCISLNAIDSKEDRLKLLKENKNDLAKNLDEIIKGKNLHFYYLPAQSTSSKTNSGKGFILDFQEIDDMSFEEALKIDDGKMDGLLLSEEDMNCFNSKFWLNSKDDFVILDGKVQSPQREHLMKNFSNFFTRIGLDDSNYETGEKIIEMILGENL